jgi:hypothetical protein
MTHLDEALRHLRLADERDLDAMTPEERRHLSDLMWKWWMRAKPPRPAPRSGVLLDLRQNGGRQS